MRIGSLMSLGLGAVAAVAAAQSGFSPPHLASFELGGIPWNVQSAGIAAYDVTIATEGAVTGAELVQDVAPYGALLRDAIPSWRFAPAREGGEVVASRVLVLGFFRPPALNFPAPSNPRYRNTVAPDEIPWPTSVAVPPHPVNVLDSGKVIMEADISDAGAVTGVRVVTGASPFDGVATEAAQRWTYRPASRNGRPKASRAFLVFSFLGPR